MIQDVTPFHNPIPLHKPTLHNPTPHPSSSPSLPSSTNPSPSSTQKVSLPPPPPSPPTSSCRSSLALTASGLVDSIQRELLHVASTTPITQASSALAPLRGALQAAVTLHTFQTLREGLMRNERETMREYATQVLADANYQRILPENAIERLRELQRELERLESPTEERKTEDEPPKEEKLPVTEEKPLATEEPQVANDTPPANIPAPIEDSSPVDEQTIRSILIEESLLQSHPSLVRWVSQP